MARITHLMLNRSAVGDIANATERVARTQHKLATGKQVGRPSDDPFATNRALLLREDLDRSRQHARNVTDGIAWQEATDSALAKIGDIVARTRELLIQAGNDTNGQVSKDAIALEIDQLAEALKQEASATYAGRFLFAGTETQTRPYAAGAVDTYVGNAGAIAREVGPGVSLQVNVLGSAVLGSGQAANDDKLLHVLRDIAQHLRGGTVADREALRGTDLRRLIANGDELSRVRATVGATTDRLETAGARLAELELTASTLLSETEDADMAEAMIAFSMQQSVYQSALRSGASIVQTSLLDFLR